MITEFWKTKLKGSGAFYVLLALYTMLFFPFWKPVLLGFFFAEACSPFMTKLRQRFHARRSTFAYLLVAVLLLLLLALLVLISLQVYASASNYLEHPEIFARYYDQVLALRDRAIEWIQSKNIVDLGKDPQVLINDRMQRMVLGLRGFALDAVKGFAIATPDTLFTLFIFILTFATFLAAGPQVWNLLIDLFQLDPTKRSRFTEFEKICSISIWSIILTGALQGILVTIGAAVAGFQSFLMIFVITFFFSMIPVLGAGMVALALAVVCFMDGNPSTGIIMVVTALIAGSADNVLRAWLFSKAAQTNPVVSLIALMGAIEIFGFPGLVISPVLEQLLMRYLKQRRNG